MAFFQTLVFSEQGLKPLLILGPCGTLMGLSETQKWNQSKRHIC
jgi:hypothetical protein